MEETDSSELLIFR